MKPLRGLVYCYQGTYTVCTISTLFMDCVLEKLPIKHPHNVSPRSEAKQPPNIYDKLGWCRRRSRRWKRTYAKNKKKIVNGLMELQINDSLFFNVVLYI